MTSWCSEAVQSGGRLRRFARNAALGLSALALTGALVATPQLAQADPPLTVDEAKAQIAELETEAAAIDQEYVGVKQGLAQSKAQLKLKKADVKSQTTKVQRLRVQAGQVALAQFQNRHLDAAAKMLLSEDTDDFLSQISTVEKVSENQNSALQDFQEEQAKLTELERSTETETAQLKKEQAELDKLRTSSDSKIAESKTVLAKLTEEERQRIAAEEQKAREEAQAAAEGTTTPGTTTSTTSTDTVVDGSSKGAQALAFAKSQLGKPYRYASAGPNAYDCSGLTSAAWAKAESRCLAPRRPRSASAGRCRSPSCSRATSSSSTDQHQPRRSVRRQRADRPRAASGQVGRVRLGGLDAVRRRPPTGLSATLHRGVRSRAPFGILLTGVLLFTSPPEWLLLASPRRSARSRPPRRRPSPDSG